MQEPQVEPRYRTVRLRAETYNELARRTRPGETFDAAVARIMRELDECRERLRGEAAKLVDEKTLDRVAWYAFKVSVSVQALKDLIDVGAPPMVIDQQLSRVYNILDQLHDRLGVDVRAAKDVVRRYVMEPSKDKRILLNETVKELIKLMISSAVLGAAKE